MKILLAHTLKPAWEVRLAEKILPGFFPFSEVEIVVLGSAGFLSMPLTDDEKISFIPFFQRKPGWLGRLWFQSQYVSYLIHNSPDVILIASPELLPISLAYSLFFGAKIIWDVQENYSLNWKDQTIGNQWAKFIFLPLVSFILSVCAKHCHGLILAEKIYEKDFKNVSGKREILENGVSKRWQSFSSNEDLNSVPYFLFSGVLTRESGVISALEFMKNWIIFFPEWKLYLAGFCPNQELRMEIMHWIHKNDWVKWVSNGSWMNSYEIKNLIIESKAVLMPYRETEANRGKRPTKWFEARFNKKPALVQMEGHFAILEGTIPVDFSHLDFESAKTICHLIENWNEDPEFSSSEYLFDYKKLTLFLNSVICPERAVNFSGDDD